MAQSPPCALVIFGASGDLALRKLIPAVYELVRQGLVHEKTYVLGYARSAMSDDQFRAECREAVKKHARTKPVDEAVWKKLEGRIHYEQADYSSAEDHARVRARMAGVENTSR